MSTPMQITEVNAEGLKREFRVVVGADAIERLMTDRLDELKNQVRLPGFRPGKVPLSLLRKRFGQSLLGEVLEKAVSDGSGEALRERNLQPAIPPKVEITSFAEGKDLEFKVAFEVLPAIEPANFAEITLERWRPQVPEENVERALEDMARRVRTSERVDRPAETGDAVIIDFEGTIAGEAFAGGSAKAQTVELGAGRFIPGFESQLAGARAGEKRDVVVTFPEDYVAPLAGKEARFATEVREVRALSPLTIDESLAEKTGFDSLQELRDTVRKRIALEYE